MKEPILKIHWERFRSHVDLSIEQAEQLIHNLLYFNPVSQRPNLSRDVTGLLQNTIAYFKVYSFL